jgi:hypothetical protein
MTYVDRGESRQTNPHCHVVRAPKHLHRHDAGVGKSA